MVLPFWLIFARNCIAEIVKITAYRGVTAEYRRKIVPVDKITVKKVFFDLLCTGQNGEQFIIEMQRADQLNFKDRMVFYTSRQISGQLPKGANHWNVELKEVYLIAILEFDFQPDANGRYLHNVSLTNTDTGEIFYNKLGYKFLELNKFVKTEGEIETDLDRWLFLLKHMSRLDKIPAVLNKRVFQKVFKIAEVSNLTKEERAMYDSNLKARWDYENSIAFAEERGIKKGIEKGGYQKAMTIARKMKDKGISFVEIVEFTGLSVQEIEKL